MPHHTHPHPRVLRRRSHLPTVCSSALYLCSLGAFQGGIYKGEKAGNCLEVIACHRSVASLQLPLTAQKCRDFLPRPKPFLPPPIVFLRPISPRNVGCALVSPVWLSVSSAWAFGAGLTFPHRPPSHLNPQVMSRDHGCDSDRPHPRTILGQSWFPQHSPKVLTPGSAAGTP